MQDSTRIRVALTAGIEKRALQAMAERLPRWVTSDQLTVLGVLGAAAVGVGYGLAVRSPHWLWLASAGLIINWFGDSLDGTLARVRGDERPRYGYYLDHAVDAFTTLAIGLGLGLSPFMRLEMGLAIVIIYLMMSINVYLESKVYSEFRMDYGLMGPTEVRIVLVALNAAAVWAVTGGRVTAPAIASIANWVVGIVVGLMALLLLWRFASNLRRLSREDPLGHP